MTNEYAKYLAHHGIKGQKWGQRNGPPYPLGASDHSAAERKAALENSRKKRLKSKSESQEKQAYGTAKKNLENALKNRNDEAGMVDAWKEYSNAHEKYLNSIDPSTLKKVGVGAAVTVGVVGVGAALYLNRDKLGPVLANLPNPARQKIIEGKIDKVGFDFELNNMARKTTSINPSLLPDEDTTLGIDTVFHRMSGDGLLQPENADHDCIFASYKPNDVDLYKMMYPLFDSNNSGSNTFKDLTLALKEPVKIPSAKKRFDTYAELLGEKSKAGDAVRNDYLKMIDPVQLAIPGYKDMVTKRIMADPVGYASRNYRLLVSRGNSTRSEGNREFFKRLISKGYNAVTDDCDAGVQADHPVIFMKNIVSIVESKDVSTKSKDYFEAAYRAVPVDDSDRSLSSLYHHGILGQKWGKRNGPPYPLGASDHSAAEKKAMIESHRSKHLTSLIIDKQKKSRNNKKDDILGLDHSFKLTAENASDCAKNINPSGSRSNCGSVSSAVLQNAIHGVGKFQALNEVPKHMRIVKENGDLGDGYDPKKLIECYEGASWSNRITSNLGNRKAISKEPERNLLDQGNGAKGIFYFEKLRGRSSGHYFAYAVIDNKVHVLEGQPKSAQQNGIDWHEDFYKDVGHLLDPEDGNKGAVFTRLDNHPAKEEREKDLFKKNLIEEV